MAEELRQFYNEALNQVANAESAGTKLQNNSDSLMHIRKVVISAHLEAVANEEGNMIEVTKRASRSQSVGLNPPTAARLLIAGATAGITSTDDINKVAQKTEVYARGAYTLETGESLHTHLTELKAGGTLDAFVDIQFHY